MKSEFAAVVQPWFIPPDPQPAVSTVTILGAGLAGCATAHHLAEAGVSVQLLERNAQVAAETSGNPAGLFKPQVNSQNKLLSSYFNNYFNYFETYLDKILKEDQGFLISRNGVLESAETGTLAEGNQDRYQLRRNAGSLSPAGFCRIQLQHPRITLSTNCAVELIEYENNLWYCRDNQGNLLAESHALVLANACDVKQFRQTRWLDLQPLSGQITLLRSDAISPSVKRPVSGKHYLIPLPDGQYLCGATHHRGYRREVTDTDHHSNIIGLKNLLPDHLVEKNITGGRTGVRCVCPDRLPITGAVPDLDFWLKQYNALHHGRANELFPRSRYLPGLYVISGLGSHGIVSSPFLGRLLSDLITSGAQSNDREISMLLHPGRFLIRELRKKPKDRKHLTD